MALSSILVETKDFRLEVGKLTILEEFRGQLGYRLINKRTELAEQEGFKEADAIRATHSAQTMLDRVLDDPAGDKEPEYPVDLLGALPTEGGLN